MNKIIFFSIFVIAQFFQAANCENVRVVRTQKISSFENNFIVETIVKSTDNLHFAYIVKYDGHMYLVHDSEKYLNYNNIKTDSLVFSPDGKRLAYIVNESSNVYFVAINGVRQYGKNLADIKSKSLIFSPDSQHLMFIGKDFERWFVVVDNKEGQQFDEIFENSFVFSPDSRHIAYLAKYFDKIYVVIDDNRGDGYEYFPPWSTLSWSSPTTLRYLLLDIHNDIYNIKETLVPKKK